MKKNKDRFQLNELLLVIPDAGKTYSATMKRGKMADGSRLIHGKVVIEEGQIVSKADSEEELAENLDQMSRFKLHFNLHRACGRQTKFFKSSFFHN